MGCKDLTERILTRGLGKTNGQTPATALYAAIREIDHKGKDARSGAVIRNTCDQLDSLWSKVCSLSAQEIGP